MMHKDTKFISFNVKKGDKFLLEIEIMKDMDLIHDGSSILKSVYSNYVIEDEFKVNALHLYKSLEDYKEQLFPKIKDAMNG